MDTKLLTAGYQPVGTSDGNTLHERYGFFTVGVRNLTDEDFEYWDSDIDNTRIQPDRYFFANFTLAVP